MPSPRVCLCGKCSSQIKSNAYKVQCNKCQFWYHRDCANLTIDQIQEYIKEKSDTVKNWICDNCNLLNSQSELSKYNTIESVLSDKQNINNEMLILENSHLKRIIKELEDKNDLLKQNKTLLEQKVRELEIKIVNKNHTNNTTLNKHRIEKQQIDNINQENTTSEPQMAELGTAEIEINSDKINRLTIPTYRDILNKQPRIQNERKTGTPNKKLRGPPNIGTASTDDESDFAGKSEREDKKVWLFISRVKDHVSEDKIKMYIKKKTKIENSELTDNEIIIKHIPTVYDTIRKDCKCFQVGIKFDRKDIVYQDNFWPKGVAFRRFKFNLNVNNTQQNNSNEDF